MCTVSIVPLEGAGFRLAGNRDESRARPEALAPEVQRFGDLDAILPIDPQSCGTWIAVNTAGVVMTLLNIYPGAGGLEVAAVDAVLPSPAPSSRGGLIPSLLHVRSARDASRAAAAIDLTRYAAFRLVVVDEDLIVEMVSEGGDLRQSESPRTAVPALFTSSGLGDARVRAPRTQLFEEMVAGARDLPAAQDAYHRHSWPGRESVSVCMRRREAATVSLTVVEVRPDAVRLVYRPGPPDTATTSVARTLPRERLADAERVDDK